MMRRGTLEVAKTVLEVADVAWTAVEMSHHHHHNNHHVDEKSGDTTSSLDKELEELRSENERLRKVLEENLNLLKNVAESPFLLDDCPPDLHARLLDTVESPDFLDQLKSLHENSVDGSACEFPFKEASGADLESAGILINAGLEEPSWWVWVSDETVSYNAEERSGIDNDNYVVISEEQVVDAVANFVARCVMSNPKALTLKPEEMQKTLTKALGGESKFEKMLNVWHAGQIFYVMATWGLALAGLYRTRAVVKLAALGVHHTSKVVLKAL